MIKINLLKNSGIAQSVSSIGSEGDGSSEIKRLALVKVLTILAIPGLLFAYEYLNLRDIKDQLDVARRTHRRLTDEMAKYGDAAPLIEKYTKEKKRIDGEIAVIRELSRVRLREVKTFDAIQSLMPMEAWARKISITDSLVRLEGFSSTEDGTSNLIRSLESSPFFSRVEPRSVSQENLAGTLVKRFEVEFRIGKNER